MQYRSRRDFLARAAALAGLGLLSGCGSSGPAGLEQTKVWHLGLFHVGLDHVPPSLASFRDEIAALGYREERDVRLDWRNLPDEAAAGTVAQEFVRNRVDLIVAFENQTMRAVKAATREIPIVFLHVDDPVANGWVDSLARPGGNLTGLVGGPDLPEKRIEYFRLLMPGLRKLLILFDPNDPVAPRVLPAARKSAQILDIEPVERGASTLAEIQQALASLAPGEVEGVFIAPRTLQTNFTTAIIRHSLERGLPVTAHRKEFVDEGALFSYGPDNATTGRKAARLVDRILKGASPATLPVEQSDILELVINQKVARTLGLTLPPSVLAEATAIVQ